MDHTLSKYIVVHFFGILSGIECINEVFVFNNSIHFFGKVFNCHKKRISQKVAEIMCGRGLGDPWRSYHLLPLDLVGKVTTQNIEEILKTSFNNVVIHSLIIYYV